MTTRAKHDLAQRPATSSPPGSGSPQPAPATPRSGREGGGAGRVHPCHTPPPPLLALLPLKYAHALLALRGPKGLGEVGRHGERLPSGLVVAPPLPSRCLIRLVALLLSVRGGVPQLRPTCLPGFFRWVTPCQLAVHRERAVDMSESNLAQRKERDEMQVSGAKVIAQALKTQACYAASAVGYLTGRPGACLVVSGPGLIHALGGMANANMNCWIRILLLRNFSHSATSKIDSLRKVEACRLYSKFSARPSSIEAIPSIIEKAVRSSIYGRPGACYVDIPADFVNLQVKMNSVKYIECCMPPPVSMAETSAVYMAASVIRNAKQPLLIIGKGAAYAHAEEGIRKLVEQCKLPFLPTPMGKGVIPDNHPNCVGAARSRALQFADVIVLFGARLNWILHFGLPPRYQPDVKFIQVRREARFKIRAVSSGLSLSAISSAAFFVAFVDICAEELGNNVRPAVTLLGDINAVTKQLLEQFDKTPWQFPPESKWWKALREKMKSNEAVSKKLASKKSLPMNYYTVFYHVQEQLPRDCFVVSEGANTMDIGRTVLQNYLPRHRLDAGTFGTMGVGLGFAIAAAIVAKDRNPGQRVICVAGDSAFGFSGMEVETICRYNLPIVLLVVNNNGIYQGFDINTWKEMLKFGDATAVAPPHSLLPNSHYEQVMTAFGGKGYFVQTPEELQKSLRQGLADTTKPSLINILIEPQAARKPQDFHWLTRSNL
ncbi:hypothetical protein HPG69_013027 [Diceros bicornis minor]|uniref:2-hydroxyacyl-CoA lyase n=1 Tax=Diceros bicornis minor TaxID=77932 RepID=A0A7J7F1G3_DICBM|nr:hypothetical protein HPG69_013027 [Diceros bicornis minor]